MKRIFLLILLFAFTFSLISCTITTSEQNSTNETESDAEVITIIDEETWNNAFIFGDYNLTIYQTGSDGITVNTNFISKGDFAYEKTIASNGYRDERYLQKDWESYYFWFFVSDRWEQEKVRQETYNSRFVSFYMFVFEDFEYKEEEKAYYSKNKAYVSLGQEWEYTNAYVSFSNGKVCKIEMRLRIGLVYYDMLYEFTYDNIVLDLPFAVEYKGAVVNEETWNNAFIFGDYKLLRTLVFPNGSVSTITIVKKDNFIYYCYGDNSDKRESYFAKIGDKYYSWTYYEDMLYHSGPGWYIEEIEEYIYNSYIEFLEFANLKYENFEYKESEMAYYTQTASYFLPGSNNEFVINDVYDYFRDNKLYRVKFMQNKLNLTYEFSYENIVLELPFDLEDYKQLDQ